MPQLDPTWFASQLFWLLIAFALLYVVLARLVLPPLQEVIARRQQTMDDDIAQAQSLKSQAEQARQDYERTLADARQRAQKLVDDAVLGFKANAEQQGKDMDGKLEQQLADASHKIATRKKELLDSLAPTSAELAAMIVDKLMQNTAANEQASRVVNLAAKR